MADSLEYWDVESPELRVPEGVKFYASDLISRSVENQSKQSRHGSKEAILGTMQDSYKKGNTDFRNPHPCEAVLKLISDPDRTARISMFIG